MRVNAQIDTFLQALSLVKCMPQLKTATIKTETYKSTVNSQPAIRV